MHPLRGWLVLAALLSFAASAQASRGAFTVLGQWRGMGNAPLAVSLDGTLVAVTLKDVPNDGLNIAVHDVWTWRRLYRVRSANDVNAPTLVFSPDSATLCSAHTGLRCVEARTGRETEHNVGSDGPGVSALAFSPSGRFYALAIVNTVNDSSLWLVDTWSKAGGWRGTPYPPTPAEGQPSNWIHSLAFSPDGKWLASGSGGGGVILRAAATGRRLGHLSDSGAAVTPAMRAGWTAHAGAVTALGFVSPARLVSGSRNGEVKLWNTHTGKVLSRVRLPRGLNALRVTRDGRVLAATGEGLMLLGTPGDRLKRRETLFSPQDPPTDVGVTADGRTVWTVSQGGTLTRLHLFGQP
ncbi:WD40 repeat domain-containing protein [Deinococcus sp. NW-56]|uniref:WD40 repeat domain-containing protein n=1 Tax=Deinococcus sp. NW-56 TaxID=2080419 RepID=UPI001319BEBB|nr:WD40 repeat domain-containing protein [Deinococcus sp. NW-56]